MGSVDLMQAQLPLRRKRPARNPGTSRRGVVATYTSPASPPDAAFARHVPARTRAFVDFLVEVFGGEERDPWLLAAGCETPTSFAPLQRPRTVSVS